MIVKVSDERDGVVLVNLGALGVAEVDPPDELGWARARVRNNGSRVKLYFNYETAAYWIGRFNQGSPPTLEEEGVPDLTQPLNA